ncbi:uncharacterized protein LOC143038891 isoform X3 [Oratosquilla oratoria]|uniref:uncharacterized protein LOC143038891 isoform X3 n=1 Tax=Oratosquilla oratoria TaxID=337810 RepID=UPI003F75BAFE
MPALKLRSPRLEGGRCYPKLKKWSKLSLPSTSATFDNNNHILPATVDPQTEARGTGRTPAPGNRIGDTRTPEGRVLCQENSCSVASQPVLALRDVADTPPPRSNVIVFEKVRLKKREGGAVGNDHNGNPTPDDSVTICVLQSDIHNNNNNNEAQTPKADRHDGEKRSRCITTPMVSSSSSSLSSSTTSSKNRPSTASGSNSYPKYAPPPARMVAGRTFIITPPMNSPSRKGPGAASKGGCGGSSSTPCGLLGSPLKLLTRPSSWRKAPPTSTSATSTSCTSSFRISSCGPATVQTNFPAGLLCVAPPSQRSVQPPPLVTAGAMCPCDGSSRVSTMPLLLGPRTAGTSTTFVHTTLSHTLDRGRHSPKNSLCRVDVGHGHGHRVTASMSERTKRSPESPPLADRFCKRSVTTATASVMPTRSPTSPQGSAILKTAPRISPPPRGTQHDGGAKKLASVGLYGTSGNAVRGSTSGSSTASFLRARTASSSPSCSPQGEDWEGKVDRCAVLTPDVWIHQGQRGSGGKKGSPYSRSGASSGSNSSGSNGSVDGGDKGGKERTTPQQQEKLGGHQQGRKGPLQLKDSKLGHKTVSRTRSNSKGSAGSSPAGIHSRGLSKTSSVSPAPPKITALKAGASTNQIPPNRFGFKSLSTNVKSGDSTESVNSILSEAQTVSDSNSNIFDLCEEENGNLTSSKCTLTATNVDSVNIHIPKKSVSISPVISKVPVKSDSNSSQNIPSTITSKITAHTRQLPQPQVPTVVKSNKAKSQSPSPKGRTKLSALKTKTPTASPKIINYTPVRSPAPLKTNDIRAPRVSRDSECSIKSGIELDSGLGSSSESDKIRGEGETDTLCGVEAVTSNEDSSDAWLKSKLAGNDGQRKKGGNLELVVSNVGSFQVKPKDSGLLQLKMTNKSVEKSPISENQREVGKEKRDTTITYSMARQKFAPYSRNRYGFGYQGSSARTPPENNTMSSSGSSSKTTNSGGLVKNRIAQLEQTPSSQSQSPVTRRNQFKKPAIRPTSLEKTPPLVLPAVEKNIKLTRPICRKLEYSECQNVKNDAQKDTNGTTLGHYGNGQEVSIAKQVAEDILMVASVEEEREVQVDLKDCQNSRQVESKAECTDETLTEISSSKDWSEKSELYIDEKEHVNGTHESTPECDGRLESIFLKTSPGSASLDLKSSNESGCDSSPSPGVSSTLDHMGTLSPDDSILKTQTPVSESSFEIIDSVSENAEISTTEHTQEKSSQSTVILATQDGDDELVRSSISREPSLDSCLSTADESSRSSSSSVCLSDRKVKRKKKPQVPDKSKVKGIVLTPTASPSSPAKGHIMESSTDSTKSPNVERKSVMETSLESQKSLIISGLLTESGKCTPTMTGSSKEMDQDFLIDDEIADQPGLTFGGSGLTSSYFLDDGFGEGDLGSPSPSLCLSKKGGYVRSRADSIGTASSLGADDLMLDFDTTDDGRMGVGSASKTIYSRPSGGSGGGARPKVAHLRVAIPGPRYEEEVLSPDAGEIYNEWTSIMAEVGATALVTDSRCVSREGGVRTPRSRLSSGSEVAGGSPDSRRPPTVLRPPRQGTSPPISKAELGKAISKFVAESAQVIDLEDGGVRMDRNSYHYMCQDITTLKTMLFKLKRILQTTDTINPFDANLRNSLYWSLASSDPPCGVSGEGDKDTISATQVTQENADLRRQVVLLQQQLEEKDRTIRLLQQQMTKYTSSSPQPAELNEVINAATQTERVGRSSALSTNLSRTASIDDGLGPMVSSDCDDPSRGRSISAPLMLRRARASSQPPPTTLSHSLTH